MCECVSESVCAFVGGVVVCVCVVDDKLSLNSDEGSVSMSVKTFRV